MILGLALGLSACAEPEACRIDDDCPGGFLCDDSGECVKDADAGGGEGGDCVPSAEACDGEDNDCDGEVDEAADLEARGAVGASCGDQADPCSAGRVACRAGGLVCVPSAGASEERCNDTDDDCDGDVDEGFDLGRRCAEGVGECRTEAVTVCAPDGEGVVCGAATAEPGAELCDDLDNDCDGENDEALAGGEACEVGLGQCARQGVLICAPGGETVCDAEPGRPQLRDICNGEDDDCDGGVDEEFDVGAPCWVGEGQCEREGTVRCTAEADAACDVVAGLPSDELCNSLDDDCDGATDEEFEIGEFCSMGIGRCRSQGIWLCTEDGTGQLCNAEPGEVGSPETCNGLDDDCDAQIDEIFDVGAPCSVGVGECRREAERVCGDGAFTVCPAIPAPPNETELCDGLDDDCDAATDEDFDIGGFCRVGRGACVAVGELTCSDDLRTAVCDVEPLPPSTETCNEIDDDCDGATDEPDLELEFALDGGPDAESGTELLRHDDGSFGFATLAGPAGDDLTVASVDCAWAVAWRADLPGSAQPHAIADAPDGGLVVLEGDADRSLVAVDGEGPRWRLNLGPAEEIGGMAPYADGYALVVRDEVQLLDAEGRQADRWAHGAADGAGGIVVPAIAAGPDGDLLLHWSDPDSGDGIIRRVTPAGEEIAVTVAAGGGASLTPRVQAVGVDGAVLLTGLLRDDDGVAAWLGVIDGDGALVVERGSPFYAGCVGGALAPDAAEPVLRCTVPRRLLFLHPDGDVDRSVNVATAALARDPFRARGMVLIAELDGPGLLFRRLQRPD